VPRLRKSRPLRPGATVGLAAPAGPVEPEVLEEGEAWLRELGLEPWRRPDLTARCGYLAGDDARRAAELAQLIAEPRVAGILCVRGGYGCHRIMGRLDAAVVRAAAKALMGYSDATTLLLWQRRCAGLMGFHGPMLERGRRLSEASREALARAFFGAPLPPLEGRALIGGRAEGRLTGGSLSVLTASLGTPWEIDTRGAILLFEDVNEAPYRIDRLLQQLLHAGKLSGLAGVGVGQMVGCESARHPDVGVCDVIREILEPLGVPILVDLPFGHCDAHWPWPVGGRAVLDADQGRLELIDSAVSAR